MIGPDDAWNLRARLESGEAFTLVNLPSQTVLGDEIDEMLRRGWVIGKHPIERAGQMQRRADLYPNEGEGV